MTQSQFMREYLTKEESINYIRAVGDMFIVDDYITEYPEKHVIQYFDWHLTDEGHCYWSSIYNRVSCKPKVIKYRVKSHVFV